MHLLFSVLVLPCGVYFCVSSVLFNTNPRYLNSVQPVMISPLSNSKWFWYFADRASQYIYLNINQRDALNFIMSLCHASTCFEHMCSSLGSQNCTIQPLISSHLQVAVPGFHPVLSQPVHRTVHRSLSNSTLCNTRRPPRGNVALPSMGLYLVDLIINPYSWKQNGARV